MRVGASGSGRRWRRSMLGEASRRGSQRLGLMLGEASPRGSTRLRLMPAARQEARRGSAVARRPAAPRKPSRSAHRPPARATFAVTPPRGRLEVDRRQPRLPSRWRPRFSRRQAYLDTGRPRTPRDRPRPKMEAASGLSASKARIAERSRERPRGSRAVSSIGSTDVLIPGYNRTAYASPSRPWPPPRHPHAWSRSWRALAAFSR